MNTLEKYDPKRVVAGLAGGDKNIKAAAAQNPSTALAVIASVHNQGGINLPVLARALDNTLGLIADPAAARELLDAHLTSELQAEMIAVRGDLPSVMVLIVDPEVVVAALELDTAGVEEDPSTTVSIALLILAWALNAKDREDWHELLQQEIGGATLRDLLIAAVYMDVREKIEEITPDMWVDVGLDSIDATDRLQELLNEDSLPNFSNLDVASARKRLRELRLTFEQETSSEAIVALVDKIDI